MKKFFITLFWMTSIFIFWAIFTAILYWFFDIIGLIDYHWGFLSPSYFKRGKILASFLPHMGVAICFFVTYIVHKMMYKKYNNRELMAITQNLRLWKNIGIILILLYLSSFIFDDWLYYAVRDYPVQYFLLPVFTISCGIFYKKFKLKGNDNNETDNLG